MFTRQIIKEDYSELCKWWKAWGWQYPIPLDMLSNEGIMVREDEVNICAGFLYLMTNAPIAWFTFPVSNPEIRGEKRDVAMRLLLQQVSLIAEKNGVKYIYSSLKNQSMIKRQKDEGFTVTDTNLTELIKIL